MTSLIIGNKSPSAKDDDDVDFIEGSAIEEKDEINKEDNNSEPKNIGCHSGNSGCLHIHHSRKTIQGDAEAPGEANTADVTENQVEQEGTIQTANNLYLRTSTRMMTVR